MIKNTINKFINPQPTTHNPQPDSGQIVLILVLVTVVGLTIGLSLISRTITDIRISSQIEQSSRAFSAAEAGIESALKGTVIGGPVGTVSLPGASAEYSVSSLGGASTSYNFSLTEANSPVTLWLIEHNDDGATLNESANSYPPSSSLDICWGTNETSTPAIMISLFYKDGNDYKIAKSAYDSITRGNNFILGDTVGSYCDSTFRFKKTIAATTDLNVPVGSKLLYMRITPLYESTGISVKPSGGNNLSIQGKAITSVGQTSTGVVRRIQVNQSYPVLPSLLDFTFFSED